MNLLFYFKKSQVGVGKKVQWVKNLLPSLTIKEFDLYNPHGGTKEPSKVKLSFNLDMSTIAHINLPPTHKINNKTIRWYVLSKLSLSRITWSLKMQAVFNGKFNDSN